MSTGVSPSITSVGTAFGTLWLAASGRGLCRLALPTAKEQARFQAWLAAQGPQGSQGRGVLALARQELQEYLTGSRRHFTVPLDLQGSAFFRRVWDALRAIPYGQTLTYAAVAVQVQRPRAVRAVGVACARNPVPLIIPCHRVVGSNGALRGFGGGVAMKAALLKLEGADIEQRRR